MMSIKCLVLLGLLVASASARPGIIYSLADHPLSSSLAQSQAHSIGGGTALSTAYSTTYGGVGASHASALTVSDARSIGLGPASTGDNLNPASSNTHSSTSDVNPAGYVLEPAHIRIARSAAVASAISDASLIGFGPSSIGDNLNIASTTAYSTPSAAISDARSIAYGNSNSAVAHSSASTVNNNYYAVVAQTNDQANDQAEAQTVPQYYYILYR